MRLRLGIYFLMFALLARDATAASARFEELCDYYFPRHGKYLGSAAMHLVELAQFIQATLHRQMSIVFRFGGRE